MKTSLRFILSLAVVAGGFTSTAARAATAEEQQVLGPVQAMFDGMAAHNGSAIVASALPGAGLVIIENNEARALSFAAFGDRIAAVKGNIEERIHDPLIRIDRDLAVVWAPFVFLREGKLDHCGTDLFNLVRKDDKWIISSVTANQRKDCAGM